MEVRKKKCKVCGKSFRPFLTLDRYCSLECFKTEHVYSFQKRESSQRTKAKQRAKQRDGGRCQLIPYLTEEYSGHNHKFNPQSHHIIFTSSGGPDEDWNLVTLCSHCHNIVHTLKSKAYWQGLLLAHINGAEWLDRIRNESPTWSKKLQWRQQLEALWNEPNMIK